MELRLGWYRICKIFCYLILTGVFTAHTKENDKGVIGNRLPGDSPRMASASPTVHTKERIRKPGEPECEDQPDTNCSEVAQNGNCIDCKFDEALAICTYGKNVTVECEVKKQITCKTDKGDREFKKEIICQYCYQTPLWQQTCSGNYTCKSVHAPRQYFRATCEVHSNVTCFGNRRFQRMMPCNWKNGYRWSTAFILSITLGGFGADRFYLGRWQEGIGKLFSFGGLGLWTIIDIILIGVRYLGPVDGSLYVD